MSADNGAEICTYHGRIGKNLEIASHLTEYARKDRNNMHTRCEIEH